VSAGVVGHHTQRCRRRRARRTRPVLISMLREMRTVALARRHQPATHMVAVAATSSHRALLLWRCQPPSTATM
jgi:hypothetical protein